MSDREFLFPIPGSALRTLLDFKAEHGVEFSDDEAAADIMLALDRVDRGQASEIKPIRYYAKRWKWSRNRVNRAFSGRPGGQEGGYYRDPVEPWIRERAESWRNFHGGQPGDKKRPETTEKPASGRHRGAKPDNSVVLPDFIDGAVWSEWMKYRREIKKTLKPTTIKHQLKQLQKYHDNGHDANQIIRASIAQGWTGLFEPKSDIRGTEGSKSSAGSVQDGVRGRSARQTARISNDEYIRAAGYSEDEARRIAGGASDDSGRRPKDKHAELS